MRNFLIVLTLLALASEKAVGQEAPVSRVQAILGGRTEQARSDPAAACEQAMHVAKFPCAQATVSLAVCGLTRNPVQCVSAGVSTVRCVNSLVHATAVCSPPSNSSGNGKTTGSCAAALVALGGGNNTGRGPATVGGKVSPPSGGGKTGGSTGGKSGKR